MIWSIIVGGLIGAVGNLIGRVVSEVSRAGSRMLSAGKDMMRGFVNGIRDMAGNIAKAAMNAVSGAVNAVKGFLGIRSPSRLFMAIGTQTGEGLAIGLEVRGRPYIGAASTDGEILTVYPYAPGPIEVSSSALLFGGAEHSIDTMSVYP